ncbi:alpha-1,6-mannosyl-glycoprotein 2-beta-N-acetylglucosaminyltransferase isoform X2 [Folsomia candida]|uniref:Alpha-1,6-mannosyl-glycoprotein 2-beta-N-acetylglucosaminyltransferase n=1 Tax=Folsomia candida TaxID=158441 RepID=A0A226D000_FOLCA|nr:alpha-1,6-mannosyl-glycoprotein 2-beta-N-acetylglucosaminyltransferase isoform X2 [Folsomia candida]OXA38128.1 hypothetical protein Fcan01_27128 [Folsomia candida]
MSPAAVFPKRLARYILVLCVLSLLAMNLYISHSARQNGTFASGNKSKGSEDKDDPSSSGSMNGGVWAENGLLGTPAFINVPETEVLSDEEISQIAKEIETLNDAQTIYNLDKFGPVGPGTFVIVIQVHSRVEYLSLLVESLSRVPQIDNCLVIFSHDLFNPGLNEAIQSIDFTRVMQIFYPFSIQLNPHRFPGESPDDCPRDMPVAKAQAANCRNAQHPDVHGHFREASYTQPKHHWWWKANFIFGGINVLRNYTGVVAFLEEDHYVTPDFLWVLNLLETAMIRNSCKECNLIALGTYLKTWNIRSAHNQGVVTNWVTGKHNMGMAFNRSMWESVRDCSKKFCNYDDYNWDWTLLSVSDTCLKSPLQVYYPKAPRIFHIGDCGVHHKKANCDPASSAQAIDKGVKTHQALLFPDKLGVQVSHGKKIRLKQGNGGWGDIRDRQLCLAFSTINSSKPLAIRIS